MFVCCWLLLCCSLCALFGLRCVPFVVRFIYFLYICLSVVRCPVFVVGCVLRVVRCLMFVVRCLFAWAPSVVCCFDVQYSLCGVRCVGCCLLLLVVV